MGNREFVLSPIPESDVQTMLADAEKRNYCVAVCGKKEVIIHNYKKSFYRCICKRIRRKQCR